jgi:16S rRNA (uracil1498-N3)-methyltransferase
MHRFYLPPAAWRSEPLQLDAAESHHALDVLRLEKDDRVTLFDGRGEEMTASISRIEKGRVELRKITGHKSPPLRCQITLGQAIPKGKNMDLIVEKATELGASAIQPLISERTVVQYSAAEAPKKAEKWQRVAIEAAKPRAISPRPKSRSPSATAASRSRSARSSCAPKPPRSTA